ncbi:MAG: C39 family peptidase [Candidatus Melainabacteria bacterium]|nr:C39 family peptidase [Candidatus Melainabacteria bacterium]MBI3308084.1 C39 family peptidase [Candidatus Melainabacteria bacterium]
MTDQKISSTGKANQFPIPNISTSSGETQMPVGLGAQYDTVHTQISNMRTSSSSQGSTKTPISGDVPSTFVSQKPSSSTNTNEDSGSDNANCGPTTLLMIARMFGKEGGGATEADDQIEQMRGLMGATSDEGSDTNVDQLAEGAQKMGLDAEVDQGGVEEIEEALNQGKKVIVNVNPKEYGGEDVAHFAVVTSIDGDTVTLFDPLEQKPITINKSELQSAMSEQENYMVKIGKKQ